MIIHTSETFLSCHLHTRKSSIKAPKGLIEKSNSNRFSELCSGTDFLIKSSQHCYVFS